MPKLVPYTLGGLLSEARCGCLVACAMTCQIFCSAASPALFGAGINSRRNDGRMLPRICIGPQRGIYPATDICRLLRCRRHSEVQHKLALAVTVTCDSVLLIDDPSPGSRSTVFTPRPCARPIYPWTAPSLLFSGILLPGSSKQTSCVEPRPMPLNRWNLAKTPKRGYIPLLALCEN